METFNDYIIGPILSLSSQAITNIPFIRKHLFGTADGKDVNLPPVAHFGELVKLLQKFSVWGRHNIDRNLAKKLGHIYCWIPPPGFGGGNVKLIVNISEPELVKKVLQDTKIFPTRGKTGLSDTVGEGLVELPTGDIHSFHRRIIGSLLTHKHLINYVETIREETEVLVAKWFKNENENTTVNAHYDLTSCAQEIIGIIGLGQRFGAQHMTEEENTSVSETAFMMRRAALSTALGATTLSLISSSKDNADESRIRKDGYKETIDRIDIALRSEKGNMINAMKTAVDDYGEDGDPRKFTLQEIIDEFITIRGAGHETTSNTLSWVLLLLAQNPDKQNELFFEVNNVIAGVTATFKEAENLDFTKMCIYEALRLYPTVPSFPRLSVEDTTLGGYDLPAGTLVFVSQSVMNIRHDLWGKDAKKFHPRRFDREDYSLELVQSMPKGCPGFEDNAEPGPLFGFAPFGAGKRTCPGQRLALLESTIILSSLIKHFQIELANPNKTVRDLSDITLGPKDGLYLKLKKRNTKSNL